MPVVASIAQGIIVVTPGGVPDRSTFEFRRLVKLPSEGFAVSVGPG